MSRPTPEPSNRVTRDAKSRRAEEEVDEAGATSTSALKDDALFMPRRVGFHRSLQEKWFTLLSSELEVERELVIEHKTLALEHDDACSSRDRRQQARLDAANSTVSEVDAAQRALGVLSRESNRIRPEGNKFLKRYTTIMERSLAGESESGDTPVPKQYLSASAAELFASDLCEALSDGYVFDATRDHRLDWDVLVAQVVESSSPACLAPPITADWIDLMEELDEACMAYAKDSAEAVYFCDEVGKIVHTVAITQVALLVRIDRGIKAVQTTVFTMIARNAADAVDMSKVHAKIDEEEERLERISTAVPRVREAIEEQILQLVILSKGT